MNLNNNNNVSRATDARSGNAPPPPVQAPPFGHQPPARPALGGNQNHDRVAHDQVVQSRFYKEFYGKLISKGWQPEEAHQMAFNEAWFFVNADYHDNANQALADRLSRLRQTINNGSGDATMADADSPPAPVQPPPRGGFGPSNFGSRAPGTQSLSRALVSDDEVTRSHQYSRIYRTLIQADWSHEDAHEHAFDEARAHVQEEQFDAEERELTARRADSNYHLARNLETCTDSNIRCVRNLEALTHLTESNNRLARNVETLTQRRLRRESRLAAMLSNPPPPPKRRGTSSMAGTASPGPMGSSGQIGMSGTPGGASSFATHRTDFFRQGDGQGFPDGNTASSRAQFSQQGGGVFGARGFTDGSSQAQSPGGGQPGLAAASGPRNAFGGTVASMPGGGQQQGTPLVATPVPQAFLYRTVGQQGVQGSSVPSFQFGSTHNTSQGGGGFTFHSSQYAPAAHANLVLNTNSQATGKKGAMSSRIIKTTEMENEDPNQPFRNP